MCVSEYVSRKVPLSEANRCDFRGLDLRAENGSQIEKVKTQVGHARDFISLV